MRIENNVQDLRQSAQSVVCRLLREAKRLHRAAALGSLIESLPVLRRLIASGVIRNLTLPALLRQRAMVQRKHVLQMLADEAGYSGWETYRAALVRLGSEYPEQFDLLRRSVSYPNLWLSTMEEAERHVALHGGRAVRVGRQAVVLAPCSAAS